MRLLPRDDNQGWTPYAWLVYVVPFLLTPTYTSRFDNPRGWLMFSIATLVLCGLYFRSYWVTGRELMLVAAATTALGIALWPISYGAGAMFIYAAGMIGNDDKPRRAWIGVAVIAVIAFIEGWYLKRDWFSSSWPVVFTIMIGAINIHYAQVGRSNARLRMAHDEIEHLAKVAERERIARDLHDLLGHTLSLVIMKSELAAKLSDRDPARAREEIRDVERISREALAEVRAAVAGYRSGGLDSEAERARNALSSAGVEVQCDLNIPKLAAPQEAVLALAMREAVTNIVRHACARKCRIAIESNGDVCTLTVSDDGRGGNQSFGSGLTGMRERVQILGGTMSREGRRGTTLTVTLPLGNDARAERSA